MPTRGRALCTVAVAGLMLAACEWGNCLHSDCRMVDSFAANVRRCGFPGQQIDSSGEVSKGVLGVGQRISLQLKGDLDRVVSVTWIVKPPDYAPDPPRVALERRSDSGAVLVGLAPGGTHPADFVFAYTDLVFRDGTTGVAGVAYCKGTDWTPAHHIVVR